ncbi:MAG: nucleoside monophosphate kinase [Candidatus Zambryskibacteria bacterium]|nr:nucleoside monophosphate kinase [Candidatus Zambryskibacteria bacterium]
MLHTVIFIGRSGCGKGTQADLIKDRINRLDSDKKSIIYVESGEHFRRFVNGNSYSSKLSRQIYEADDRQPDFLACFMWSNLLLEELGDNMHIVFDGAARSRPEAELLTIALKFYGRIKPAVIYLDVSRAWSEKRLLSRGRSDDVNISKINKRLDWFDKDVLPAIEFFKNNPYYRFIEIDGEQSIEKVHSDIIAAYDYQA